MVVDTTELPSLDSETAPSKILGEVTALLCKWSASTVLSASWSCVTAPTASSVVSTALAAIFACVTASSAILAVVTPWFCIFAVATELSAGTFKVVAEPICIINTSAPVGKLLPKIIVLLSTIAKPSDGAEVPVFGFV